MHSPFFQAGASNKRIAAANAATLKQLRLGMAVSGVRTASSNSVPAELTQVHARPRDQGVYLLHLFIFSSGRSYRRLFLFAVTEAIAIGLWNQLQAMAKGGQELNGSKGLVRYVVPRLAHDRTLNG